MSSTTSAKDPLAALEVFDRLEVGPIKLEKQRLTAPYRLYYDGQTHETDLVYSYDEDVFDPDDPTAQNLASLMAVQVALNYGLFCKKIVFHGVFDGQDRRFLREMMENTCREIFVNKFLHPNPFLIGDVVNLPPIKATKYTRAVVEFPQSNILKNRPEWQLWQTDHRKHCILSSGGKDSLLSFGLINELGYETHPVFINESGRHWFTALNAFRHFHETVPNTARVWVNSDRVFNWFKRHMPFIRKNFHEIRADMYPIRLWTVAVFLFGALPLMRKRGISRLLIGDEFDTTIRTTYQGITHYEGLFDQSRYFDFTLSRFYLRKGWAISQFSILRPLSEILVQSILVKRYPQLQAHQVSCHATHKNDERVYPCGKCEKCRRIVGMLLAMDADPKKCGYSNEKIQACLNALKHKGVHQEAVCAQHTLYLLNKQGWLKLPVDKQKFAKAQPIVGKLRFDPERAPLDGIPVDLRRSLYSIYMEYATAAVQRSGRTWIKCDPFTALEIRNPYTFEADHQVANNEQTQSLTATPPQSYLWGELTWPEAEKRLAGVDVALLPVGAIEQHGPHLPLDTDAFDADYLAKRVAQACSEPLPLVLPLIAYGVSYHHNEFKGTISISNDVLARLVYEIGMNLARNGIKKLVIINGHGGNDPTLNYAAQMINRDAHIFVCVDSGATSDVDIYAIAETKDDVHAGEIETSTTLAVRPHLVKMELAVKQEVSFSSPYLNFSSNRGISWHSYTKKFSPTGIMGDPTRASVEKGEKFWQIMISHLVALVEDLKTMTPDEILQIRQE